MTKFERLSGLEDVILIRPKRISDDRGFFAETFRQSVYSDHGIDCAFVQDNQAHSRRKGTLRGLHFQKAPNEQAKLVWCISGAVLDVAVDIRPHSPTFGRHIAVELSAAEGEQLFVPAGFAHGYCTLEDETQVAYRVSSYYAPHAEGGVAFDDPALGIQWPFPENDLVLTDRDRNWPGIEAFRSGAGITMGSVE